MDGNQHRDVTRMFPGHDRLDRVVCLDIQDRYHFLDPELVSLLVERTQPHFDRLKGG
jgi:predicted protein tyrosine phosphatase